jgi:hypothetical protein
VRSAGERPFRAALERLFKKKRTGEHMPLIPLPYLDPGSGSFLIQLLIAALLGLGVAIRASWGRIKGWFGVKPKADEDDDESEPK